MAKELERAMNKMGESMKESAQATGRILKQGAKDLADGTKEMLNVGDTDAEGSGLRGIEEHMPVVASCGRTIGLVDHVEGEQIKLTRKDSPDGHHHFIPLSWVSRVDEHVHLNVNSSVAQTNWK